MSLDYPKNLAEANRILDMVRAGCGQFLSQHIIMYCLAMTGDLK